MNLADRVILMHQGGWDELLLVLGPLIIIVVLVVVARKQVPAGDADDAADRDGQDPPSSR